MLIKKTLLFIIAGNLWLIAGSFVTGTGFQALALYHPWWILLFALIIYLIFYLKVFSKLVRKHESRIMNNKSKEMPFWAFFDRKSYITMAVMMSSGILLRKSGLLPLSFFSFFYTGLGLALFSCGLRFIYLYFKYFQIQRS